MLIHTQGLLSLSILILCYYEFLAIPQLCLFFRLLVNSLKLLLTLKFWLNDYLTTIF
jgi:hypothetical protein